jgi:hypothetical protein
MIYYITNYSDTQVHIQGGGHQGNLTHAVA